MSWDFLSIMESIIGSPSTDAEGFLLYLFSAVLGMSLIMFVYGLFHSAREFLK